VCRLALLSDAASLATQLETKLSEMESWLDGVDAEMESWPDVVEDSVVSVDHDKSSDTHRLTLERQSVTVRITGNVALYFTSDCCMLHMH